MDAGLLVLNTWRKKTEEKPANSASPGKRPWNSSIARCAKVSFSATFKEAFVTPVLKRPGLDATSASSYRPIISNLSVLSKVLERLVARQLMEYLSLAHLLPPVQSGFRQGYYSTETAILQVLSDILQAVDRGDLTAVVLLDLPVDHSVLLQRSKLTVGIGDTALCWFQSYLSSRKQYVRRGPNKSSVTYQVCGKPKESLLGPILFVLYTADLLTGK